MRAQLIGFREDLNNLSTFSGEVFRVITDGTSLQGCKRKLPSFELEWGNLFTNFLFKGKF